MNDSSSSSSLSYDYEEVTREYQVIRKLYICISAVCMFTNTMVVLAFISSYNLRERVANYFILNLSINDFVTGFVNLVYQCLIYNPFFYGSIYCWILSAIQPTVFACSFMSMALVSLDRYIYITSPLCYHMRVTAIRVKTAILCSWVIPIIIVIVIPNIIHPFYHVIEDHCIYLESTSVTVSGPIMAMVTMTIMLFSSISILIEARKQRRRIVNQGSMSPTSVYLFNPSGDIRRLVNTGVLVLIFLIMWLPYIVTATLVMSKQNQRFNARSLELAAIFVFLNSAINPMLYAMNPDFKKAYLQILRFKLF
ncbi:histamine H2 receptor-like [Saccoglossus kowalevskii]|uniref:Histamine H2 receptor-like n=1 Tax=Saccoglossus kowalevskii TaxID=10224 RepID=A0ABM0M735_SACKO|nr:PREDICTED: histamine H2 receptor-like [Saccoglossus kowalevskii]